MERTALEYQINKLRDAIVGLRSHLDDTLDRIEDFGSLVDRTAEEAKQVAETLGGRPSRGILPMSLLGFVGLGVVALWIFSPQTLTRLYDQVRSFVEQQSRQMGATARERFGGTQQTL